jgi:hypothetical protein
MLQLTISLNCPAFWYKLEVLGQATQNGAVPGSTILGIAAPPRATTTTTRTTTMVFVLFVSPPALFNVPELADGNLSGVSRGVQTCSCDVGFRSNIQKSNRVGYFGSGRT